MSSSWISRDKSKPYYGKRVTKDNGKIKPAIGSGLSSPKSSSSGGGRSPTPVFPDKPPQTGMVLQYTADGSKVRYYNPDTKGRTSWRNTKTLQITTKPSSRTPLVTEAYLRGEAGAVGGESSGIKREVFSRVAYASTRKKADTDIKKDGSKVKYLVTADGGQKVQVSKGIRDKLVVERQRAVSHVFKNLDKYDLGIYPVTAAEAAKPTYFDKLFGTDRKIGTAKIQASLAAKEVPSIIKKGFLEVGKKPSKTLSQSFQSIGTGIYKGASFVPALLGVKTGSGAFTEHGRELSTGEYLNIKTSKYGLIPKIVEFTSMAATFRLFSRPFTSTQPQIRTVTKENVFTKQKIIKGKALSRDIRPSFFQRAKILTKATGNIKSTHSISGTLNSLLLKKSKVIKGYSGRFVAFGRLTGTGKAATGLKIKFFEGIGKVKIIGKYSKGKFTKLWFPKESKYIFKSAEVLGKNKISGIWGGIITKKPISFKFVGFRKYISDRSFIIVKHAASKSTKSSSVLNKINSVLSKSTKSSYTLGKSARSRSVLTQKTTQLSGAVSSTAVKVNQKLLPALSKVISKQEVIEDITVGASAALGASLKLDHKIKTSTITLSKLKINEKSLTAESVALKQAVKPSQTQTNITKSFSAVLAATTVKLTSKQEQKQKVTPIQISKSRSITKTKPIYSPQFPPVTIPVIIPPPPPILILPDGSRDEERRRKRDLFTGYKEFSIPKILLSTKSFNLKIPKVKVPKINMRF